MRYLWISIEWARSSFAQLHEHMPGCIRDRIVYADWDTTASEELWRLFDFDEEWVSFFTLLQIRFVDGQIFCCRITSREPFGASAGNRRASKGMEL